MASIDLIRASDGSGNANVATVQSSRAPAATTLDVDTVAGIPAFFMASMGTPHTFTDPVTSETITVISEATCVDFAGHVDGVNLEIDTIAPGYTDGGSEVGDIVIIRPTTQWADELADILDVSHDDDGTLKAGAVDNSAALAAGIVTNAKLATSAGEIGAAWQSFTPTLSGRLTDAKWNKTCKYIQIGKTVHARYRLVANTTTPMAGGSTDAIITLPVTSVDYGAIEVNYAIGSAGLLDSGSANYPASPYWFSTTTLKVRVYTAGSTYASNTDITSAIPFTWTTNDEILISITYEAA